MALRIPWDKYETALLIEAWLNVERGVLTSKEAVSTLSIQLRQRAIANGTTIDEKYRNENGVTLQLMNISLLMRGQSEAAHTNSKVFADMVNLYLFDRKKFNAILEEAKRDPIEIKPLDTEIAFNKDCFARWLSGQKSRLQVEEYLSALTEVETFVKGSKLYEKLLNYLPIYVVIDPSLTEAFVRALEIETSRKSSSWEKSHLVLQAARLFDQYTKEHVKKYPAARKRLLRAKEEEPLTKLSFSSLVCENDFEKDFTSLEPVFLYFRGVEHFVCSWTDLYLVILKHLYSVYPSIFKWLRNQDSDSFIYGEADLGFLTNPVGFAKGFYVDIDRNISEFIHNIKKVLDSCSLDYDVLTIRFYERNNSQTPVIDELFLRGDLDMSKISTVETQNKTTIILPRFENWMKENGITENIARIYASSIGLVDEFVLSHGYTQVSLFEIADNPKKVEAVWNDLFNDKVFWDYDREKQYYLAKAMSKFVDFSASYCGSFEEDVDVSPSESSRHDSQEVDSESVETVFVRWMTNQSLPKDIAESFASSIRLVDAFVLRNKISDDLLFTIVDGEKIEALKTRLDYNPNFWVFNSEHHYRLAAALNQYIAFRMSLPEGSFLKCNEKEAQAIKEDFILWAFNKGFSKSTAEAYFNTIKTIDLFALNYGLAGTSFFSLEDLEEVRALWKKLLNDPHFITYNTEKQNRFSHALKRFIAFKEESELIFEDEDENEELEEDEENEVEFSEADEDEEFDQDEGNEDDNFEEDEDEELDEDQEYKVGDNNEEHDSSYCQQKEKIEKSFSDWMRRNGLAESTITVYLGSLKYIDEYIRELKVSDKSLYAVVDKKQAMALWNKLEKNSSFNKYNKKKGRRFSVAIRKYLAFCEAMEFDRKTVDDQPNSSLIDHEEKLVSLPDDDTRDYQLGFEYYLKREHAPKTANRYLSSLEYVEQYALNQGYAETPLFEIEDFEEVISVWNRLKADWSFVDYNREKHYIYSSAMQQYIAFREEELEYRYNLQKEEFEANFSEWMRRNKYANSTIYVYLGSLALLEDYIWEHYDSEASSLYAVTTCQEANALWNELKNDSSFYKYNLEKGRRFSTVMRLYIAFFEDLENEDARDVDSSDPDVLTHEESAENACVPEGGAFIVESAIESEKNQIESEMPEENEPKSLRDSLELGFSAYLKSALSYLAKKSEFKTWLIDAGKNGKLASSYNDSLLAMSVYLFDKKMEDRFLFTIFSVSRLERILKELIADPEYRSDDPERDLEALRLYIQFRKGGSSNELDDEIVERYSSTLRDRFENGFRIDSMIDRKRFKLYYSEIYGEDVPESDEEIVSVMEQIGTLRDGRVYLHDGDNQKDLLDDVQADIAKAFRQGASCVYFSCVLEKYRTPLASQLQIYTEESLSDRLFETCGRLYNRRKNYFYLAYEPNPAFDVQLALEQSLIPTTLEDLQESLWFLPVEQIKKGIYQNKNTVTVAKETYFYAPNFPTSPQELNQISELIHAKLTRVDFICDHELRELIDENFPALAVDTADFTPRGLRAVFASLLGDRFSFKGAVISELDQEFNMSKAFEAFCEDRERMSFSELKEFADEMNSSTIYWDAVFEKMLRISESEFVRKGDVHFNVREIDAFLKTLIDGDYTSIRDVNLFLHFPPINVKWNVYVLEGYVAQYSKDFILLHSSYSSTGCFGAIVKKSSPFNSLDMIAVDVLAGDDEWNSTNDAVETLVREGYIQRKTFAKIDEVVEQAMALRAERTRN